MYVHRYLKNIEGWPCFYYLCIFPANQHWISAPWYASWGVVWGLLALVGFFKFKIWSRHNAEESEAVSQALSGEKRSCWCIVSVAKAVQHNCSPNLSNVCNHSTEQLNLAHPLSPWQPDALLLPGTSSPFSRSNCQSSGVSTYPAPWLWLNLP